MEKNIPLKNAIGAIKLRYGIDTQKQICDRLDCNLSYLSDLINGKSPLSRQFITKFQREFNVNPAYLETGEGEIFLEKGSGMQIGGKNNTQIVGNDNQVDTSANLSKALDEIAEQRKLVSKAQEQIDRLLGILENQQK